jgi:hypothetical protein
MTMKYRMTETGTEQIAEDGTVTLLQVGTPDYQTFFDWLVAGGVPEPPSSIEPLSNMKTRLAAEIDNQVAVIYSTWTRFRDEYVAREAAAQAYKDTGYAGDVSGWISGFADAADKTAQEATDLILAQSASLRGALEQLGALRMRKYEVLMAIDRNTANAAYNSIMASIQAVAAAIQ